MPAENVSSSQVLRRDFLTGAAAGLTAGAAAGLTAWNAAPASWHEAKLPAGAVLSFAQNGEDLVAASMLRVVGIDTPSYLDIGAYLPILSNNTYYFYRKGGRGVLVEPNVALRAELVRDRPGDLVLTAGIGTDEVAEADYYVTTAAQLNTFDKASADRVPEVTGGRDRVLRVEKMPLLSINKVIAEHFRGAAPDYLSVDAEGLDLAILRTLDFTKYRPAVVCAEHSQDRAEWKAMTDLMGGHGYTVRGGTYPNVVFVDDRRLP